MTRFLDVHFSSNGFYAIGLDVQTGTHYLSIPRDNGRVTYEEMYKITTAQYESFISKPDIALAFAEACRREEHDDLLILGVAPVRGEPLTPPCKTGG